MSRPRIIDIGDIVGHGYTVFQEKQLRGARPDDVVLFKYSLKYFTDGPAQVGLGDPEIDVDGNRRPLFWRAEFFDKFSLSNVISHETPLTDVVLRIPMDRTVLHEDPLEWFSDILTNSLICTQCVLHVNSSAAKRIIPLISLKWHSLVVEVHYGSISAVDVKFSAFKYDNLTLHNDGYSVRKPYEAYQRSREPMRYVIVLLPASIRSTVAIDKDSVMILAPYDRLFLGDRELKRGDNVMAFIYIYSAEAFLLNQVETLPGVLLYPMPTDMIFHVPQIDGNRSRHLDDTFVDRMLSGTGCIRTVHTVWHMHAKFRGTFFHATILDVCIALAAIELSPYVLNWILEWLPDFVNVQLLGRMRHIDRICTSIRGVYQRRKVAL